MSDGSNASHELPLLLGASADTPESLILIGAPDRDGSVVLRRWTADDWSAAPTTQRERADALLQWLDAQASAGRTMNQSMYAVRLWLRGGAARGG